MKKILIIEDEEMLVNMYESKFKTTGYDFIKAINGEDGLVAAQQQKPDLILLDVILPKMDGFLVLKKLKEDPNTKDIPVILLTNLGQDEDKEKGKAMGAVNYLVKANLTPTEVVDKVQEILK
jgi:DNA-binding response OmpR family regulator